jgi:hypothetical protein
LIGTYLRVHKITKVSLGVAFEKVSEKTCGSSVYRYEPFLEGKRETEKWRKKY